MGYASPEVGVHALGWTEKVGALVRVFLESR